MSIKSIYKNHITGESLSKVKEKNGNTIGVATIELFDENGNKTIETINTNYYTDLKVTEQELLYQNSNLLIRDGYSQTNIGDQARQRGTIIFTDSDMPEDKNDPVIHGNVIAFCPATDTNAGSDSKRCSYSPQDSATEIIQMQDSEGVNKVYYHEKRVYNFATTQGNGVIKSIYWSGSSRQNYPSISRMPVMLKCSDRTLAIPLLTENANSGLMLLRNGNFYNLSTNKFTENTELALNCYQGYSWVSNESGIYEPAECVASNGNYVKIKRVAYTNGTAWSAIVELDIMNSNDTLLKNIVIDVNKDNCQEPLKAAMSISSSSLTFRLIRHFTLKDTLCLIYHAYSGNETFPNLTWDGVASGKQNYGYCMETIDMTTGERNNDIFRLDNSAIKYMISGWNSIQPFRTNGIKQIRENQFFLNIGEDGQLQLQLQLINTDKFLAREAAKNCITNLGNFENNITSYGHSTPTIAIFIDNYRNAIIGTNGSGSSAQLRAYDIIGPTAHTKLMVPVEKTSANSMKVTYDIYIECSNRFAKKGEEHIFK